MKLLKMGMAIMLTAGILGMGHVQVANACNKTPDCYAIGKIATCRYVQGSLGGAHIVTEPNGYSSYCSITVVSGTHDIRCAGCNADLGTEYRTCSQTHSNVHCFSQKYLCK